MSVELKKLKDKIKQLNKDVKFWRDEQRASENFEKEFRHFMFRINNRDYDSDWKNIRIFEALYHLERQLP